MNLLLLAFEYHPSCDAHIYTLSDIALVLYIFPSRRALHPEEWYNFTMANLDRSNAETASSSMLRAEIEDLIKAAAEEITIAQGAVDKALATRIEEYTQARSQDVDQLAQVRDQILYTQTHIYMYVCIKVCVCMCMYLYIYIYVCVPVGVYACIN